MTDFKYSCINGVAETPLTTAMTTVYYGMLRHTTAESATQENKHLPIVQKVFPVVQNVFPMVQKVFPIVQKVFPIVQKVFPRVQKVFPIVHKVFPIEQKVLPIVQCKSMKSMQIHEMHFGFDRCLVRSTKNIERKQRYSTTTASAETAEL